jgi:plastocyanin
MKAATAKFGMFVLAVGLAAAACSKSSTTASQSPSPSGAPPSAQASASSTGSGTITVGSDTANNHGSEDFTGKSTESLEADDFYFSPTVLKGSPGQKLKITIENEGTALHNFSQPQQGVDQDIQPGAKQTVSITFPQSGFLEFFCKYHRTQGMVGELKTS